MKAAVISGNRMLEVQDVPRPSPSEGEVLVHLEGCGVCASNLPAWKGRPWFNYPLEAGSPGHEGWGDVDGMGRVAFLSNHAYAEYDVAPTDALVRIPDVLARFPGEPFGCAMNIFRRSDIQPHHTVAIIGAGFLGNALVQLCKAAGARVIAISRRESAREIAAACGADETIPMADHNEIVRRAAGVQRVIECVGMQWPLDIASDIVAEGGRLIIAGYHQDGLRQVNMQKWNWLGIDVINAHERDARNYVRGMNDAIDAIAGGRLHPDLLLTHAYALDELGRALDDVEQRPDGFVKGTVLF